jgi:hypothetical protein
MRRCEGLKQKGAGLPYRRIACQFRICFFNADDLFY